MVLSLALKLVLTNECLGARVFRTHILICFQGFGSIDSVPPYRTRVARLYARGWKGTVPHGFILWGLHNGLHVLRFCFVRFVEKDGHLKLNTMLIWSKELRWSAFFESQQSSASIAMAKKKLFSLFVTFLVISKKVWPMSEYDSIKLHSNFSWNHSLFLTLYILNASDHV